MIKIQLDKKLNFLVSLGLAIILSIILASVIRPIAQEVTAGTRTAIAYCISLIETMAIGIYKELRDHKQAGNHFCWYDLLADAAGALLGSLGAFVSYII